MYRNVNEPKRISPYDLQGISRLSSTPPSKAAFIRFPSSTESNKTQKPTESENAELEAERRWIPVSENPAKSDWYLIMYRGYRVPDAGYYDVEAGWLSDIPIPDCWMPMPEPPEVK